jgi:probable phosphoglycerate mutase
LKAAIELVLVRHGRIAGQPMRPRDADPLSAIGQEQARRAAAYLAREQVDTVLISSPLLRARQTAHIISAEVHCEIVVVDALTEMTRAELRRIVVAELTERWPFGMREARIQRAENMRAALLGRLSGALNPYTVESTSERLIAVAHGGVIWGTLAHYFPQDRARFSRGRQVANASVTRIRITPAGAELIAFNETAHLGDLVTY